MAGYISSVPRHLLCTPDVSVGAKTMTPVIFITIGFLSCWFLLYTLVEWTQDPKRRPGVRRGADTEISQRQRRSQQVVNFRSKKDPRERKMPVTDSKMRFTRLCLVT